MVEAALPWILFNLFVLLMLGLDLFILGSKKQPVTLKEALAWSTGWIALALLFNLYIFYTRGLNDALSFLTGYLIEKSLSLDNLFVFILIFKHFQTPPSAMHKVLFWGILGAMVMRGILIALGVILIARFHWLIYPLGFFLIYAGIRLWLEKDKEIDLKTNPLLNLFYRFFPVTKEYVDNYFFVCKAGKYCATPLCVTLMIIEVVDLIFAMDSLPAIFAITLDPFLIYTANIFAILGLRSLYFVLSHLLTTFHYLHYGLAIILVCIGLKILAYG